MGSRKKINSKRLQEGDGTDPNSAEAENEKQPKECPIEKPGEEGSTGFSGIFRIIYMFCALSIVMLLVITMLLSVIYVISYHWDESTQKKTIALDSSLKIKDTTDMNALEYVYNNTNRDPYRIYVNQKLLQSIYVIISTAIIAFGVHLASWAVMWSYTKFVMKEQPCDKFVIPKEYIGILMLGFIGAAILTVIYNSYFIMKAQKVLETIRTSMSTVKAFIYSNMTSDFRFLEALTTRNFDTVVSMLVENAKDIPKLQKMLFTLNVYTFYITQIAESDPARQEIKSMFTSDGVAKQKVDPALYFYYKRPVFVPNLYTSVQSALQCELGVMEPQFIRGMQGLMQELNERLRGLQEINQGKRIVRNFMWKYMITAVTITSVVLAVLLLVIFKDIVKKIFFKVSGYVKNLIRR